MGAEKKWGQVNYVKVPKPQKSHKDSLRTDSTESRQFPLAEAFQMELLAASGAFCPFLFYIGTKELFNKGRHARPEKIRAGLREMLTEFCQFRWIYLLEKGASPSTQRSSALCAMARTSSSGFGDRLLRQASPMVHTDLNCRRGTLFACPHIYAQAALFVVFIGLSTWEWIE